MRASTKRWVAAVGVTLNVFSVSALASVQDETSGGVRPIAMPNDSRIVVFPYVPNSVYTILARPMAVTNLQLAPDEKLVTLAMGDTAQWMTNEVAGHLFFKPLYPNLVTSATLVTTKRTYQITLRSSPEHGKFYQQVSWQVPKMVAYQGAVPSAPQGTALGMPDAHGVLQQNRFNSERINNQTVGNNVAFDDLNFAYNVTGDEGLTPTHVFDDGRFTWVRLDGIQEMPAVFMINSQGETELLNFVVKEPYIVIQRLLPGILLKQGSREARITKKDAVIETKRFLPFRIFGD